jgi:hypothetical protein
MTDGLQHCPACDEEYVASVTACVECGGPLQPGPLERLERRARDVGAGAGRGETAASTPSRLLTRIAGLQADHAVRALLLEGIACRVDCQGLARTYQPGQPPAEPFAVTLPVSIYVDEAQLDAAQDVLSSFEAGDLIGDQWSDEPAEPAGDIETFAEPIADREPAEPVEAIPDVEPVSESTSLRTVVLIVVAAIVLLFLFGR